MSRGSPPRPPTQGDKIAWLKRRRIHAQTARAKAATVNPATVARADRDIAIAEALIADLTRENRA